MSLAAVSSLLMALVLMAALVAISPGRIDAQPAEEFSIDGRVVNGTEGADLPGQLLVLMLVTGADGLLSGTGQAVAGADGRFTLENVKPVDGGNYTLSVDYGGVFYTSALAMDDLPDEVTLTVHEPTQDYRLIGVERQVMVLAAIDSGSRMINAIEFIRVENASDLTLMPDLTLPAQISFLRFALPPDASEVNVQSSLRGGDVISIGSGFALTAAVPPGNHSVDFSYSFPYEGSDMSYRQSLPQGAGVFQVLVPERFGEISVPGLMPVESIDIQGTRYRAWEGRDIAPGQGLQLELANLPQPGLAARIGKAVAVGTFWQIAIPSALGAALAALLALGLVRRSGHVPASATAPDADVVPTDGLDGGERASLVLEIAELDERRRQGGLPEDQYQRRRQDLVARILNGGEEEHRGPTGL